MANFVEEGRQSLNNDHIQNPIKVLQPPKPNDVSLRVGKSYSSAEKLRVLKNLWNPDQSFDSQLL